MFNWLFNRWNRRNSQMNTGTGTRPRSDEEDGVLGLGNPQQMVGHTGFTRGAGGGQCVQCKQFAAVLMEDHKCVRCTNHPIAGSPLGDPETTDGSGKTCSRK